ncbi:hypothetical protein L6452_06766 [Arctium lappa]|uniref:Uncharacterized protein n=1 Tax=Arctium lappa TaxID=4217 RepID=A0ACB9EKF6_ARCLA|nr:hypothetical protein L6452_06766 [Arctium lappa]
MDLEEARRAGLAPAERDRYEARDEARKKFLKEQQLKRLEEKNNSENVEVSDDEDNEDALKVDEAKVDESKQMDFAKVEKCVRTTSDGSPRNVRNLHIREDTTKYLLILNVNYAHYDPKTRSMREDPLPDMDPNEKFYVGDNHNRVSSQALEFKQLNIHAWEVFEKENDVHMQAAPPEVELLYKNYKVNREKLKSKVKETIMEKHGNAATEEGLPRELLLGQSEKEVEYDRAGPDSAYCSVGIKETNNEADNRRSREGKGVETMLKDLEMEDGNVVDGSKTGTTTSSMREKLMNDAINSVKRTTIEEFVSSIKEKLSGIMKLKKAAKDELEVAMAKFGSSEELKSVDESMRVSVENSKTKKIIERYSTTRIEFWKSPTDEATNSDQGKGKGKLFDKDEGYDGPNFNLVISPIKDATTVSMIQPFDDFYIPCTDKGKGKYVEPKKEVDEPMNDQQNEDLHKRASRRTVRLGDHLKSPYFNRVVDFNITAEDKRVHEWALSIFGGKL